MTGSAASSEFQSLWETTPSAAETPSDAGSTPAIEQQPAITDQQAIDAAYDQGVQEGRRLAADSLAAQDVQTLEAIRAILTTATKDFDEVLAREKEALREATRQFLLSFAERLNADHEVEAALSLVEDWLNVSSDEVLAELTLSPTSVQRLAGRFSDILASIGAEDSVTVIADPALKAGEIRLKWRDGAVQRTYAEIHQSLNAVFAQEPDQQEDQGAAS